MTTDTRAIVTALGGGSTFGPISTDARAIINAINGSAAHGPISTDARAISNAFLGIYVYGPISMDARGIIGAIQGGTTFGPISRDAREIVSSIIANAGPPPEPEIPSVTNAEKLALPGGTAIGTQVSVSDGFYDSNGTFWWDSGTVQDGAAIYIASLDSLVTSLGITSRSGGYWSVYELNETNHNQEEEGTFAFPWLVTYTGGLTITHPALQQLAASPPSDEANWIPVP